MLLCVIHADVHIHTRMSSVVHCSVQPSSDCVTMCGVFRWAGLSRSKPWSQWWLWWCYGQVCVLFSCIAAISVYICSTLHIFSWNGFQIKLSNQFCSCSFNLKDEQIFVCSIISAQTDWSCWELVHHSAMSQLLAEVDDLCTGWCHMVVCVQGGVTVVGWGWWSMYRVVSRDGVCTGWCHNCWLRLMDSTNQQMCLLLVQLTDLT